MFFLWFSYGLYTINCHFVFPLSVVTMAESEQAFDLVLRKGKPGEAAVERAVRNIDGEAKGCHHEPILNTNMGMYTMLYQDIYIYCNIYSLKIYLGNIVR